MGSERGPLVLPDVETDEKTRLAPRYRVFVHNDDVTPMDFVTMVLLSIFQLGLIDAMRKMLEAHRKGIAHVCTLTLEEAELRCERAHSLARPRGYPLTFTYEPEE